MRQVVATALALLLALFLMPLLLVPQGEGELPAEQGGLPLDRTVVTPGPSLDSGRQVKVKLADGRVETMAMDDYLWRVVAAEMPAAFEPEALKAQAVAARTYTCAKMERTTSAHPEADVCTDVACCQACRTPEEAAASWGANARMYTDKIAAAVTDTDGLAVLYGGKPIQAVFFSSADGRTVDAVEVWALSHRGGQPRGGGGAQLPLHRHADGGGVQSQTVGQVPRSGFVGGPVGLVFQYRVQLCRRGGVDEGGGRHRQRAGAAHPLRPALHQLYCVRRGGGGDLRRHRLWTRGGHESVRGQRPGQGGQALRGDLKVVLHRGGGSAVRAVAPAQKVYEPEGQMAVVKGEPLWYNIKLERHVLCFSKYDVK